MFSVNRRAFFKSIIGRLGYACPALSLFGLRFCQYSRATLRANGNNFPWAGWIEWFGRTICFVDKNGSIVWIW